MSRWAICSDRRGDRSAVGRRAPGGPAPGAALLVASLTLVAATAGGAAAQEVLSQGEALRLAFGEEADVERRTAFLGPDELQEAAEMAGSGVEVEDPVVTHYVARRDGEPAGAAYFDAHPVRTLTEVLMIVVDPEGAVRRVEVLRFDEPREYLPPDGWLEEFDGARLSDASSREVPNVTGATLTSRAVEAAVRRTLALHELIAPFDDDGADGGSGSGGASGPRTGPSDPPGSASGAP